MGDVQIGDQSENVRKEPTPPNKAAVVVEKAIDLSPSGALAPKDHRQLGSLIAWVAKGGGFPARFKTKEEQLAAYNLAHSLMGAHWQLALNGIAIVHGQMCIYGELPGTLAEHTKEVEEKHVFVIDKDYNEICMKNKNLDAPVWAAVCKIKRKGRELKEFFYTRDEAVKADQIPATKWNYDVKPRVKVPNPDSPWEKHFKVMLMRKAMAMGVNFEFPESKCGVPIAEYDFDVAPDLQDEREFRDVPTETVDKAAEINAEYGDDGETTKEAVQ